MRDKDEQRTFSRVEATEHFSSTFIGKKGAPHLKDGCFDDQTVLYSVLGVRNHFFLEMKGDA